MALFTHVIVFNHISSAAWTPPQPFWVNCLYPNVAKRLINVLWRKNTGWRLRKYLILVFQLNRHCSYQSYIIKCLPPVGHFDCKYVELSKPNFYGNYTTGYSKSDANLCHNGKWKCSSCNTTMSRKKKSLAVSAYKCIMHVGREFLCKNDLHFSPLLIIEDMVKGLRRHLWRMTVVSFIFTHVLSPFPLPDVQCVRHQLWWSRFTARLFKFHIVLRGGTLCGLVIPSWWYGTPILAFLVTVDPPSYVHFSQLEDSSVICVVISLNSK